MKQWYTNIALAASLLMVLPEASVSARTVDFGFENHGKNIAAKRGKINKAFSRQNVEAQSLVWGWCGEPDPSCMGPGPDKDMWVFPMIGLTSNLATKYDGCKIKSILIARGQYAEANPVIDIVVSHGEQGLSEYGYASLTLTDNIVTMENVAIPDGQPCEWMEYELPEPIEIEAGVPIYAGYKYKVLSIEEDQLSLCVVSDMVYNNEPNSSWMDVLSPNPETGELEDWGFWSNEMSAGSNCIRLRIEGDRLPQDDAVITAFDAPSHIEPGQPFDVTMIISNAASAQIESLDVKYGFAGEEQTSTTISDLKIKPGRKSQVKLSPVAGNTQGNTIFSVEITSVNGTADVDPSNNYAEVPILNIASDNGFKRNVLVEEGTGTWCGNCPRGLVAMEKMSEKYPDNFIGVGVHSDDAMAIEAYLPYLNKFINPVGYPYCTLDRAIAMDPSFNELEPVFNERAAIPAIVKLDITDCVADETTLNFTANAEFALTEASTSYAWAFVVTEDNVGPYSQANYYTDGSLDGWDHTESVVKMYYNEVATAARTIMGDESALITSTTAGDISSIPVSMSVAKRDNQSLIAILLDTRSGEVQNAYKHKLSTVGVGSVAANDSYSLSVSNGTVTLLSGENVYIHSLTGVTVANLAAGQSCRLSKGIYVVSGNGKTQKIIVR